MVDTQVMLLVNKNKLLSQMDKQVDRHWDRKVTTKCLPKQSSDKTFNH